MIAWYYLVIISSLISVLVSVIQKRTLKMEHATQYSAASSFLLAIVSLIFIPFANFNITPLQLAYTVIFGAFAAVTLLLGVRVIKHAHLSATTPVSNTLPLFFIVVFAYAFLSEKLTTIQYFSVAGIIITTYLMLFRKKPGQQDNDYESSKYKYLLVINAIVSAAGSIVGKYLLVHINVFTFMIISQIVAATCLAAFATIKYGGPKEIASTVRHYRSTFFTIVSLILILRVIYYFALKTAPISIASTLNNAIFVLVTVPIGGFFFKEDDIVRKTLMSAIITVFAYLLIQQ
ncbi:MAG: EamA family transporter [Candidatus Micrarchaeota archaeon]|nr:EamA family transporter [Candidatus Micrarchaeota archaeon]MDE1804237.1 EamA family transporter [Candidatus Micrarchaeota archaeon]MDE1846693.1 EamA family transporter [Candidatus Micrarchaeota archaeon]